MTSLRVTLPQVTSLRVTLPQNALTTAGTLSLPSARSGSIKGTEVRGACHSTASKCRRLQSALLVAMCILRNCYLKLVSLQIPNVFCLSHLNIEINYKQVYVLICLLIYFNVNM